MQKVNFWVKKPKNSDFDPVAPISERVNIKVNSIVSQLSPKNWRAQGGTRMTTLVPALREQMNKYSSSATYGRNKQYKTMDVMRGIETSNLMTLCITKCINFFIQWNNFYTPLRHNSADSM